jgi:predicted ATPase
MIDYIDIQGYKSIKSAKVDLAPINILIGANGSGKSNFLSFFELIKNLYNQKLQNYIGLKGGEDKILYKGGKVTNVIKFKMEFDNGINGYAINLERGDNHFIFSNEYLIYEKKIDVDIANFGLEANIKQSSHFRAKYVIQYLDNFEKYHFHDTGKNSDFNKTSHVENDIYFLYNQGSNIASLLYHIRETQPVYYNRIVKVIQSIAPYFLDFYLVPNKEGFIRLQWQSKYSETIYGATDFSDGTIRFIALTVLFLQPKPPKIIIIDEPELGLHPFAIAKLAGMIQSVAAKGIQVILATQSVDLINHFEAKDVITIDQIGGESVFQRLDENKLNQWLDEYSIGDLWQRNIIGQGQPFEK